MAPIVIKLRLAGALTSTPDPMLVLATYIKNKKSSDIIGAFLCEVFIFFR